MAASPRIHETRAAKEYRRSRTCRVCTHPLVAARARAWAVRDAAAVPRPSCASTQADTSDTGPARSSWPPSPSRDPAAASAAISVVTWHLIAFGRPFGTAGRSQYRQERQRKRGENLAEASIGFRASFNLAGTSGVCKWLFGDTFRPAASNICSTQRHPGPPCPLTGAPASGTVPPSGPSAIR
jgi:hypothetical protein